MDKPVSTEIKVSDDGKIKETVDSNNEEDGNMVKTDVKDSQNQSREANEDSEPNQDTESKKIIQDFHQRVLDIETEPSVTTEEEGVEDLSLEAGQEGVVEDSEGVCTPSEVIEDFHQRVIDQETEPSIKTEEKGIKDLLSDSGLKEPLVTKANTSYELPASSEGKMSDPTKLQINEKMLQKETTNGNPSAQVEEETFQQHDASIDTQETLLQEIDANTKVTQLYEDKATVDTNQVIPPKNLREAVDVEDMDVEQHSNLQHGEVTNETLDMPEKLDQGEMREALSQEVVDNHENNPGVCDDSLKKEEKQVECIQEDNGNEAKTDKDVEDELDSLANMIEHMALVEAPSVECNEKEGAHTQELDPSTEEVEEEALEKIEVTDTDHVPSSTHNERINDQPGDSHPEPYRLTKDSQSTEQEMNEAIAAAAKAEHMSRSSRASDPGDMLHHIKQISFKDKNVGIVTQNENGPCPLVAIINTLLLRWEIELPATEIVSAAKLMEYIGNAMLESVPKDLGGEAERLNYEQNMHDAMAVLPKLQTGLDVNVKFTGVRDFEYTPECIIFDLFRIPLYHGWLVDPQEGQVAKAVGQAGYNQLVEKVISQKCSANEAQVTEALIIENFLDRSASQLTYHGLAELNTAMNEGEIGVLFRNNHFSTIYKHQNELLQLVTDQGFLGEPNVVWETLSSIDGDGQFVDSHFRTVPPKPEPANAAAASSSSPPKTSSSHMTAEQQIDHDFLVALSLQDEQQPAALAEEAVPLSEDEKSTQERADEELARQLQREEERQAATQQQQQQQQQHHQQQQQPQEPTSARSPQQKKKDCNIL